jgi:hypothetical protein
LACDLLYIYCLSFVTAAKCLPIQNQAQGDLFFSGSSPRMFVTLTNGTINNGNSSRLSFISASCLSPAACACRIRQRRTGNQWRAIQLASIQLTLSEQAPATLYLEARHVPLGQVLKEIVSKTGARIHYSVLPDEPVTATCASVTVKQVMECLLGSRVDRIYRKLPETLLTKAKAGLVKNSIQPQEILQLGSSYGNASGKMQCVLDGSQGSENKQNKAVHSEENPNIALIRMAQITNDPRFAELRKQALSMLATQGKTGDAETDTEITETLHKALTDKDAEMRA